MLLPVSTAPLGEGAADRAELWLCWQWQHPAHMGPSLGTISGRALRSLAQGTGQLQVSATHSSERLGQDRQHGRTNNGIELFQNI